MDIETSRGRSLVSFAGPSTGRSGCGQQRVCIIESNVAARRLLQTRIDAPELEVRTFSCAQEFLLHSPLAGPTCLVMNQNIVASGLRCLQRCSTDDRIAMSLVLITDCGDVLLTIRISKAGLGDLVATPPHRCDLARAVRDALAYSEAELRCMREIEALRARQQSLSGREREVMDFVCAGLLNKQIAHELGISVITVKAHRGNAMRKMKARSLAEMVKMAARLEHIPVPPIERFLLANA